MALILLLFVGNKAFLSGTILQGHSKHVYKRFLS